MILLFLYPRFSCFSWVLMSFCYTEAALMVSLSLLSVLSALRLRLRFRLLLLQWLLLSFSCLFLMESSCTSCCTSTCAFSCLYRTVCPSQLIRCHRRRPRDAVFISECNVSVCPLLCHNSKCVFRDNFITSVLLFSRLLLLWLLLLILWGDTYQEDTSSICKDAASFLKFLSPSCVVQKRYWEDLLLSWETWSTFSFQNLCKEQQQEDQIPGTRVTGQGLDSCLAIECMD